MLRVCLVLLALLPLAEARAADGPLVEVRQWTIAPRPARCWAFNRPVNELNWQPIHALFWSVPAQGPASLTFHFWPGAAVDGVKQLDVTLPPDHEFELPVQSSSSGGMVDSLVIDPVPDDFIQALRTIGPPAASAIEGVMMEVSAKTPSDSTGVKRIAMRFDVTDMPEVWRRIAACLEGKKQ
jgi:hypothetical protein